MKTKRLIALVAALLLLCSVCSVSAAYAGSADDPLLSRSYLTSWSSAWLRDAIGAIDAPMAAAYDRAAAQAETELAGAAGAGIRTCTLNRGATLALTTGDAFTLTGGAASVAVQRGALVDATAGAEARTGSVRACHRYIACENLSAVLTSEADGTTLLISGRAQVSRFTDVKPTDWYAGAVEYVYTHGLMDGIGNAKFAPNSKLTRAMFVTVLGRLAGVDPAGYPGVSFSDSSPGSYYAPYVEWAAKNGIVNGVGGSRFAPNREITREAMATIIARYVEAEDLTLPESGGAVAAFRDASKISGWAQTGVELMRVTGILQGDNHANFHPQNDATRAEAATVFMRLREALISIKKQ